MLNSAVKGDDRERLLDEAYLYILVGTYTDKFLKGRVKRIDYNVKVYLYVEALMVVLLGITIHTHILSNLI